MTVHGMHREASIEINASPEAVYDLVSDLPRMGEWSPENIGGEWQGGGSGKVGDRFLGHNRTRERSWSVPVMVPWNPPKALDTSQPGLTQFAPTRTVPKARTRLNCVGVAPGVADCVYRMLLARTTLSSLVSG